MEVEGKVSLVDLAVIRRNPDGGAWRAWTDTFRMHASNLRQPVGYDLLVVASFPIAELMTRIRTPAGRPLPALPRVTRSQGDNLPHL